MAPSSAAAGSATVGEEGVLFFAALFVHRAPGAWMRVKGTVGARLHSAVPAKVAAESAAMAASAAMWGLDASVRPTEGLLLHVDSETLEGNAVPARVRELWLGRPTSVKFRTTDELQLFFALPSNPQGFSQCALAFAAPPDLKLVLQWLHAQGLRESPAAPGQRNGVEARLRARSPPRRAHDARAMGPSAAEPAKSDSDSDSPMAGDQAAVKRRLVLPGTSGALAGGGALQSRVPSATEGCSFASSPGSSSVSASSFAFAVASARPVDAHAHSTAACSCSTAPALASEHGSPAGCGTVGEERLLDGMRMGAAVPGPGASEGRIDGGERGEGHDRLAASLPIRRLPRSPTSFSTSSSCSSAQSAFDARGAEEDRERDMEEREGVEEGGEDGGSSENRSQDRAPDPVERPSSAGAAEAEGDVHPSGFSKRKRDFVDPNDPEVQRYVMALLADQGFKEFTEELGQFYKRARKCLPQQLP